MSPTVRYLGVELPPAITDEHVRFTARLFARSAALFREQFGGGRFAVVIFPGSKHAAHLVAALDLLGVDSLDYSALLDYDRPEHFIPEDWHPSTRTYRILAERLVEDLGLREGAIGDPARRAGDRSAAF